MNKIKLQKNKSGFSIMEMILAMGLLTIISLLFMTLMLFSFRMANNASVRSDNSFISSGSVAKKYAEQMSGSDKITIVITDGEDIEIEGQIIEENTGNQKYNAFIRGNNE